MPPWSFLRVRKRTASIGKRKRINYTTYCFVKGRLTRLTLILCLLCIHLGSSVGVMANAMAAHRRGQEVEVSRYGSLSKPSDEEHPLPLDAALHLPSSPYRLVSSRPVRLLPTFGGRTSHHSGRWNNGHSFNSLNSLSLQLRRRHQRLGTVTASPRLYYIITLRRLLC